MSFPDKGQAFLGLRQTLLTQPEKHIHGDFQVYYLMGRVGAMANDELQAQSRQV